jgi:hypothetical protein
MTYSSEILNLTRVALEVFEESSLDASARRALRIAQLRGDADEAWLLRTDLRPGGGADELRVLEISSLFRDAEYAYIVEADRRLREMWLQERTPLRIEPPLNEILTKKNMVFVGSIADLQRQRDHYDGEKQGQKDPKLRAIFEQRASLTAELIERIRFRIYSYLCRVETELNFSRTGQEIFEQHRRRVDRFLSDLATDVLEQFTAAYRRMSEGDIEARTHALTSCRRILKSVADVAYPARSQPVIDRSGKSRDVSDEKYVNRLWLFLGDAGVGGTLASSMRATVTDTGNRIDALYELACKGVHAEVSNEEVEWCVVQTYLLAGEILRLGPVASDAAEGSSEDE